MKNKKILTETTKREITITGLYLFLALVMYLAFTSCTVEKRLYRPGLHVELNRSAKKDVIKPELEKRVVKVSAPVSQKENLVTISAPEIKENSSKKELGTKASDQNVISTFKKTTDPSPLNTIKDIPTDNKTSKTVKNKRRRIATNIFLSATSLLLGFAGLFYISAIVGLILLVRSIKRYFSKGTSLDTDTAEDEKTPSTPIDPKKRAGSNAGLALGLGLLVVLVCILLVVGFISAISGMSFVTF